MATRILVDKWDNLYKRNKYKCFKYDLSVLHEAGTIEITDINSYF